MHFPNNNKKDHKVSFKAQKHQWINFWGKAEKVYFRGIFRILNS